MSESILTTVKQTLGSVSSYDEYDPDIITHINSVFSTLWQIGVGPDNGFAITGYEETWDDFMTGDPRLSLVKSFVGLKVRKMFDPPQSSSIKGALDETLAELEWRILVASNPGGAK